MAPPQLTVVVPVLNEEKRAGALAHHLNSLPCPVIVVDGGSSDDTRESLAGAAAGHVTIIDSAPGRGRQMNAGAVRARTPVVLFLHADTELPPDGVSLAVRALGRNEAKWGRFDVRFDHPTPLLHLVARFMNWRSAATGICTGDQGLFMTMAVFEEAGGFADIPLMEDIDLCRRLKRIGKPARVRSPVVTAARRWRAEGTARTVITMWWLRLRYWMGASPATLAKRYGPVR